jgi:hypothetical protein
MGTGNPHFDPPSPLSPDKSDKDPEVIWKQKRAEIDKIVDGAGRGIDEGIKETIVALNLNGISTAASCEGYPNVDDAGQRPWPWVLVQASDEPAERFIGQQAALRKTAEEHNMTVEELERSELYWDVLKQVSNNPLTPEYQAWAQRNGELSVLVSQLLNEFYVGREVEEDIRIKSEADLYEFYGEFDLESVVDKDLIMRFLDGELTDEEKRNLLEKLPRRQQEMQDFTAFLRNRFFSQGGDTSRSISEDVEKKKSEWDKMRKQIEAIPNIDPAIIEAVVAFNMAELRTSNSCEGHLDWGRNAPWITVAAADFPEKKIEQTEAMREKLKSLLAKFYEKRQVFPNMKIILEAIDQERGDFFVHNGEEDFHHSMGAGHGKGTEEEFIRAVEDEIVRRSAEDEIALRIRLENYRAEFDAFAHYLKDLFLSGEL